MIAVAGEVEAPTPAQLLPLQPLAVLEVVRHPSGGWTIATPIDGSRSTTRLYSGWWSSRAEADAVFQERYPYAL